MITAEQVADDLEALMRGKDATGLADVLADALDRYALARLHVIARRRLGPPDRRGWCPWCQTTMLQADFTAHLESVHAEQLAAK